MNQVSILFAIKGSDNSPDTMNVSDEPVCFSDEHAYIVLTNFIFLYYSQFQKHSTGNSQKHAYHYLSEMASGDCIQANFWLLVIYQVRIPTLLSSFAWDFKFKRRRPERIICHVSGTAHHTAHLELLRVHDLITVYPYADRSR